MKFVCNNIQENFYRAISRRHFFPLFLDLKHAAQSLYFNVSLFFINSFPWPVIIVIPQRHKLLKVSFGFKLPSCFVYDISDFSK